MNFITTNHRGGLGNVLFKLSATISTAIDNNINYIFSNEFLRPVDKITTHGYPDYRRFYDNILRNINFIDKLPSNYNVYIESSFNYSPIYYEKGTNLLLDGHFQSEKYFLNNKKNIIELFQPTDKDIQTIKNTFPNINEMTSIHIRRGDYLQLTDYHPQQETEYFKNSCEIIGISEQYIIFSDDLEGIKHQFDFIPNKIFYTSGQDWLDLYTMSLCKNNIISNSTFSWWGAYLNSNINKKIIAPNRWFGPKNKHLDTSTLFPYDWIIL
jgi:hypothetical protein